MDAERRSHWIFLRGLVRESAHWDDFPERFTRAIAGARVHLLDLPGNGEHWRLRSPLSIGETMEFARREALTPLSGKSGAQEPVYLFSLSLGSMVAIEWAHRHPRDIAGAVLVNTSLRRFSPFHQRLSWRSWPVLARTIAARDTAQRERLILKLTANDPAEADALIEARVRTYKQHPVRPVNVFRQLWAAACYRPPIEKPDIPLLLLNSLGDCLVDPACTEAIARRWAVEKKTHPFAGHDLPLDDPEWTIEAVREWFLCQGR
jgi:pimeloyl-ACP methyl ester carboxylesterase